MSQTRKETSSLLVFSVILGDLIIMNILFAGLYFYWPHFGVGSVFNGDYSEMAIFNTLCYVLSTYYNGVVLHHRKTRKFQIIRKVSINCLKFMIISVAFIAMAGYEAISTRFLILFHFLNFIALIIWRISCFKVLRMLRTKGRNYRNCVYLGSSKSIQELSREMSESGSGYHILGYFDNAPNAKLSEQIPYLGSPKDVLAYLENNQVHQVYSNLPSQEKELILQIIYWCEQNFANFYHVPHIREYLSRRMWLETVGNVPVLSLHTTPLSGLDNRVIKRAFDLIVSGTFLFTVFPFIYLIVGSIIKITSPGPIFFKQKRNGINGEEFWCFKFRSMKVNKDADKIQATKNDPRKTKFGDFMRKTNIDELPQLINVFLGDMSLVGPRPHMLKHTEEYSQLIDQYMVRHCVKPGITGWAQVTGFRGETKELHEMEGRVNADIWYMEHWSFLLDLHIIYKTFANVIIGEKNAY